MSIQSYIPSQRLVCSLLVLCIYVGCKPEEERMRDDAARADQEEKAAAAAKAPPMENQIAKVGVGKKGSSLRGMSDSDPGKIIAGPAVALFNTKEKVVFEIQLKSQMDLFQAEHGRFPKSHEEYMEKIVGPIKLPELHQGMVYRYHPDDHELWVEAATPENTKP